MIFFIVENSSEVNLYKISFVEFSSIQDEIMDLMMVVEVGVFGVHMSNAQVNRRRSAKRAGYRHGPSKSRSDGPCWRPR